MEPSNSKSDLSAPLFSPTPYWFRAVQRLKRIDDVVGLNPLAMLLIYVFTAAVAAYGWRGRYPDVRS